MNRIDFKSIWTFAKSRGVAALAVVSVTLSGFASAHHPDRENHPVTPRIDVIGPIGSQLPPGYRRKYNRPKYWAGKIAYWIAPSSQEAMVWHKAKHSGAYKAPKKHLRLEQHYFYPKPWQVLTVGPRISESEPIAPADPTAAAVSEVERVIETLETETLESNDVEALQAPDQEVELELPPVTYRVFGDEASSPSDASIRSFLHSPEFGMLRSPDSTPDNQAETKVSRASVSQQETAAAPADKPVFFRGLLNR